MSGDIERMDIHSPKGTKVTPNYIDGKVKGGYYYDEDNTQRYLKEGETYTVDYTVVYGWSTEVFLEEFPKISFNSVCLLEVN